MNAPIKAIETSYAGCRFRSRLEARWAVALDAAEVGWEYEPEGFETPTGRYLPDFRVTWQAQTLWLEIKPDSHECTELDMALWHHVVEATRRSMIVTFGLVEMTIFLAPGGHNYAHAGRPGFVTEPAIIAGRSARFEFGERGR